MKDFLPIIIAFIAIATVVGLATVSREEKPKPEELLPSSLTDDQKYIFEEIKKAAGYDWTNFVQAKEEGKPASFFLLANELRILDVIYDLVDRSFTIKPEGKKKLGLSVIDSSSQSKENIIKCIEQMISVHEYFLEHNITAEEKYIKRLKYLKSYFQKYGLAQGEITKDNDALIRDILILPILPDMPPAENEGIKNYQNLFVLLVEHHNYFLKRNSFVHF